MSNASSSTAPAQHSQPAPERLAGTIQTIALGLVLYLVPPTLATLILVFGVSIVGAIYGNAESWTTETSGIQFLYVVITEAIVIGLLVMLMKFAGESWRSIAVRRPKWKHILYAIGGFAVYYGVYVLIATLLSSVLDFEQRQEIGFDTSVGGVGLVMAFVSLVVLPPIVEEILFRGFLYSRFKKFLATKQAAVALSLLFAAAHLQLGSGNALLWVAALDTFILSLVLVYLREKTGTIWAGAGVHALKNCVAFVILFVLKV